MVAQQKMKEEEVDDQPQTAPNGNGKQPGSPKSRLAMLKRSSAKKATAAASSDPFRFQGTGVTYKGKLIGVRDVEAARGDVMCADAMRDAKAAVKAAGTHKQRISLAINIEGIKLLDEKTQTTLHNFPVSRISFIARDTTDARAFGFVFGEPNGEEGRKQGGKYKFYGIKTAQTADHAVLAIRDMFQIVYEMKRKQVEQMKQEKEEKEKKEMEENGIRSENGVLVADLLDLETELHNIEQGVNQLAHIPVVAGDEWPGEQQQTAGFGQVDPFGQQPFVASTSPHQQHQKVADPFGDSFGADTFAPATTAPSFMGSTPQGVPAPSSVYPSHQLLSQSPATLFGTQPSPAVMFPAPSASSQFWGANGSPPQQQLVGGLTPQHMNGGGAGGQLASAFGSAPNFSMTNPFAAVVQSSPAVVDPFDTSAVRATLGGTPATYTSPPTVNWNLGNENSAPSPGNRPTVGLSVGSGGMPHTHSFQANFSDISSQHTNNGTTAGHQWEAGRKVSSLEEAFTKLVDMDSLVSQPQTKKNPFEHLINPPKVPLNALSSGTPAPPPVVRQAPAPPPAVVCSPPALVFPGKTNDPFADDFFN